MKLNKLQQIKKTVPLRQYRLSIITRFIHMIRMTLISQVFKVLSVLSVQSFLKCLTTEIRKNKDLLLLFLYPAGYCTLKAIKSKVK